MKKTKVLLAAILAILFIWLTGCTTSSLFHKTGLDPKNPVTITLWNYYNGAQQKAFNQLITQFNETKGKELGVIVEAVSQGSVTDLENNVMAAADGKVGAAEMPNIFAAYADTAYALDQEGLVVDLASYLSKEEKEKYVGSYWDEGNLGGKDFMKIFPIAKSIEVFIVNQTDWEKFVNANGLSSNVLANATIEDITALAKQYYDWTDSLTPQPNDGKAFFGRDAIANYMLIGARQLGMEIFEVSGETITLNFEKEIIRKLWDNYYVPFINGYFAASGRFRSDDIKTGTVVSFVGSSSGATFFPDEVITSDTNRYPIEMRAYKSPMFSGAEAYTVQQGAGMVVTANEDKRKIYASVEFLKWFTAEEQNIEFSVSSGYLPVVKSAYDGAFLQNNETISENMQKIIQTAIDTVNGAQLYTTKAFENGTSARGVLENAISDQAKKDRQAVEELIAGGMAHDAAVARFDTDAHFDEWYNSVKKQLEDIIG